MARMPREVKVDIRYDMPGADEAARAIGMAAMESTISRLIAAEVERRIALERGTMLRTLAWLAFEHGQVERSADGIEERATLRIPDRALLELDPVVSTWHDPPGFHDEGGTTAYRVTRSIRPAGHEWKAQTGGDIAPSPGSPRGPRHASL